MFNYVRIFCIRYMLVSNIISEKLLYIEDTVILIKPKLIWKFYDWPYVIEEFSFTDATALLSWQNCSIRGRGRKK